jgi:hypothetical protein
MHGTLLPSPIRQLAGGLFRQNTISAPGIGAVRNRVQFTSCVSRKPKWLEQEAFLACELLSDELTDADHLVPMIAVRNHVHVLAELIEDRKVIWRETTDSA